MAIEELYIGCVDARHPVAELGLTMDRVRVLRDIAAYIPANDPDIEAALEHAIKVDKVKRITVGGHTDCGGVCACVEHNTSLSAVAHNMAPLAKLRSETEKLHPTDMDARKRHMECAVVQESIQNLRTYKCVKDAEAAGQLDIRGWLIDIATSKAHDITHAKTAPQTSAKYPPHEPAMLLFSGMDPSAGVSNIGVNKGDALIVRNFGALVKPRDAKTAAVLEFAVNAKQVPKLAIALESNSALMRACLHEGPQLASVEKYIAPLKKDIASIRTAHPDDVEAQRHALEKRILEMGIASLRSYAPVSKAKNLIIEGWVVDSATMQKHIAISTTINPAEVGTELKGSYRA